MSVSCKRRSWPPSCASATSTTMSSRASCWLIRSYAPHVPRAIHTHFDRSLDVYRLAGEAMNNLLKNPGASAELQHDIDDAKASMFELRERSRDSTTRLPQHLS
ncbi:hypothetical protein VPH35_065865 [Triticum aestivum]